MTKRLKAYILLLLVSIIWGVASPVIKYTLSFTTPYAFLFWRFLITSLVFLPFFLYFIRKHPLKLKSIPRLVFLGFLGTPLTLLLLFAGYNKTTSIDGAIIGSVAPIFIVIGGALFLKEKVTSLEKAGLVIAVIGSLITIVQPFLEGKTLALANFEGNLLVFGSVLSWSAFTLLAKKDFYHHHPFVITAFCFFVGLLVITPFFLFEGISSTPQLTTRPTTHPAELDPASRDNSLLIHSSALPGILYMSLISSVIAYTLYMYGLSLIEAGEASLFAYLQPVFAAPLSILWLKESISGIFIIGAFLIAVGVILTEYRPKQRKTLS